MSVNTETSSLERQLSDGNSNGQVYGQSVNDKIAFYGGTPVAQTTAAATTVGTTTSTTSTPYGFTTQAQADAIVATLNAVVAALREMRLIK